MLRIAAFLVLLGGTLAAGPVAAQSVGDAPPRPPADVPNGSFPAQPPPVRFPGQEPFPAFPGTRTGIQSQPLAPPPGAVTAPPAQPGQAPVQRARVTPQPANPPSAQPANPPPPQPADTSPKPDDTIITEMPAQKIANSRAVFSGLDKITGRIINFDAAIGETVQFGALQVTARQCYTRPPTEPSNTDAFLEVAEVTLQGDIKRIFTGWVFAASPGLHAIEHPIYDIWLTDCSSPLPTQVAQPAVQPAPAPAAPNPASQTRARQAVPRQRTSAPAAAPPVPPAAPAAPTDPR